MNKIVIFDWDGVVESHENDLQDLKQAKIKKLMYYLKPIMVINYNLIGRVQLHYIQSIKTQLNFIYFLPR